MSYDSLDAQADELFTYAINFSGPHYNGTMKTLCKQWIQHGKGDRQQGWNYLKALTYVNRALIIPAAKDYKRVFGSMTDRWFDYFPPNIRNMAAIRVLNMWLSEFELGNLYD